MQKRQLTTSRKKPPTERIIKDVRTLRDNGKSDEEIRNLLGIELRTFQRYTKRIYEEDKQIWHDITSKELESELLKLRSSLEHSYRIALAMSENDNADIEERIEALNKKDDSRLSIIHLLSEYPDFIRKIPSQDKVRAYEEQYTWKDNAEQVLENETE